MDSYQKPVEFDHSHHFIKAAQEYPKMMTKRALLKVFITMQVMFQFSLVLYACMFSSTLGPPPFVSAMAVLLGLLFAISGALALKWYNLELLKFYGTVAHQATMFDLVILTSLRSEFKNEQSSKGIPLQASWIGMNEVDMYWYYFIILGAIMAFAQVLTAQFLIRDLRKAHDTLKVGGERDSNGKKAPSNGV